jgi:hypothetical protein
LLSVVALVFGKEATFVECLLVHSAKVLTKGLAGDPFAECLSSGALGKEGAFFAECHLILSAKELTKGPMGSFFVECQ